jgi:hypothetical protein
MPFTPSDPIPTKRTRNRSTAGSSRTIPLRSGGSLTLAGTFNFLDMSDDDRTLIIDLASLMTRYEKSSAAKTVAAGAGSAKPLMPPVN